MIAEPTQSESILCIHACQPVETKPVILPALCRRDGERCRMPAGNVMSPKSAPSERSVASTLPEYSSDGCCLSSTHIEHISGSTLTIAQLWHRLQYLAGVEIGREPFRDDDPVSLQDVSFAFGL